MKAVESARLVAGAGLEGDHYHTRHNGPRQITLMASEDLAAVAAFLGRDFVTPDLTRRNLITCGVNLLALKDQRFRVGSAVLEGTGECAPCSRMEANLGAGGYNAMRGRGGITARIVESGKVDIGDRISRLEGFMSQDAG
jgi:MOSC domain-containing protein YiiM